MQFKLFSGSGCQALESALHDLSTTALAHDFETAAIPAQVEAFRQVIFSRPAVRAEALLEPGIIVLSLFVNCPAIS